MIDDTRLATARSGARAAVDAADDARQLLAELANEGGPSISATDKDLLAYARVDLNRAARLIENAVRNVSRVAGDLR